MKVQLTFTAQSLILPSRVVLHCQGPGQQRNLHYKHVFLCRPRARNCYQAMHNRIQIIHPSLFAGAIRQSTEQSIGIKQNGPTQREGRRRRIGFN